MAEQTWKPKANPWLIAISVTMAAFMEVLDTTIVNVSLPHIAGAMSSGQDESTWTLTSYLIANGIVLPISGFIGRILGRKRYFLICIAGFTACSLLCGISTNLGELVFFRLLQGLFGGGLQPNQQSIVLDTFEPAQRSRAFSVTAIATIVAPVLGPVLGGWLTDTYSWRWIFLINVPIGILTFLAVYQLVEDPPWVKNQQNKNISIDYTGISFIALALGCLQVVLDRGEDDGWFDSNFICGFAALSIVGFAAAVGWLLYAKKPVVHLNVLANRNFAVGSICIFCMAFILYSSAVLLPQLAQRELNYTATWAGLILSPGAALILFIIPIVSRIMPLVQTRYIVGVGFSLLGCALVYSHHLIPNIDFRTLASMRMAQTVSLAFLFVPISTIAYMSVPKELNGDAAALYTMFRNVGGSIGISVATALVTERTQVRLAHLSTYMTPLWQGFSDRLEVIKGGLAALGLDPNMAMGILYKDYMHQATVLAYMDVFSICAVIAFLLVPMIFLFKPAKASQSAAGAH